MKTTKKLMLIALMAPFALGSASALASGEKTPPPPGPGPKGFDQMCHGGFERGMFKDLNLTDAQKTQLKEMREKGREAMKGEMEKNFAAHREEMKAFQAQEQKLVLADNFDQAAANALAKQMAEKQAERRVEMMSKRHDMLSVLTAEQKQKYAQLMQDRQQSCEQKMADHMKHKRKMATDQE